MTLTEFLLARIAEDEDGAHAATLGPWRWIGDRDKDEASLYGPRTPDDKCGPPVISASGMHTEGYIYVDASDAEHIARWHPARVLAECEAKRRIIDVHLNGEAWCDHCSGGEHMGNPGGCPTLRLLALPHADHPDYDQAWRV